MNYFIYVGDFETKSGKFWPGYLPVEKFDDTWKCPELPKFLEGEDYKLSIWHSRVKAKAGVVGAVYSYEEGSKPDTIDLNSLQFVQMWPTSHVFATLQDRARARKVRWEAQKMQKKLRTEDSFKELLDPVRERYNKLPWDLRAPFLMALQEYITRRV